MATKRAQMMEENRARLITAARKAFAEQGYASASMDELTAQAGLTRGALYHNFGDKRGLLAEGVLKPVDPEAAARLINGAALNAALWVAASDAPRDVLAKAIEAFRALATGLLAKPA